MDKVIEQQFWNRLLSFVMDVQVNDPCSQEEKDMIVTTCKAQMEPPTTPATSWEEVYGKAKEYADENTPTSISVFITQIEHLKKQLEYLSQHWPSSQPVSPTPMAETWEEAEKKYKEDAFIETLPPQAFKLLSWLKKRYPLPAPSLHQVDRWVRVEDQNKIKEAGQ